MATPDSSFRKHDHLHAPISSPTTFPVRRATVSSPAPYPFSNTFESHRPHSRNDRYSFDRPYPRRSTFSHSQGHNVNNAPQLTAHADTTMMWSGSASPSPIMSNTVVLPGTSPTPSSSSGSSKHSHPTFEYEHMPFPQNLESPMNHSFTLCPSPDFSSSMGHPRSMPPPPLLSSTFSDITARPPSSGHLGSAPTTTPALSPSASTTSFVIENHVSDPSSPDRPPQSLDRAELDSEVTRLRNRVRDLEFINDLVRLRVAELESSDNKSRLRDELGLGLQLTSEEEPSTSSYTHSSTSTPRTNPTTFAFLNQDLGPPPADWHLRTSARLKRFCALNRAGNALCAWHDSRRERRAYPPRMAPPQTLNCGCTYAEALFEESLARNGVGAFYPGESVRMDPALRNPLLKLLEERYGYRDGDFERTPEGGWRLGETAHDWEQKASNSGRSSRRERS